MLAELELLTAADLESFVILCSLFDRISEIDKELAKTGEWYENDRGGSVRHPAAARRDRYSEERLTLLRQFGMTPSSRNNLQIQQSAAPKKGIAVRKR